jgi:Immunity protein 50
MEELIQTIPGAQQLFDWFGYWPSFHDAEVLSVELNRSGLSKVRVHAFRATSDVNSKGHCVLDKHCIVTLLLDEIGGVDLADFNHQNAITRLGFERQKNAYVVTFYPAHGVTGTITAKNLSVEMTAGIPADSQYKT